MTASDANKIISDESHGAVNKGSDVKQRFKQASIDIYS